MNLLALRLLILHLWDVLMFGTSLQAQAEVNLVHRVQLGELDPLGRQAPLANVEWMEELEPLEAQEDLDQRVQLDGAILEQLVQLAVLDKQGLQGMLVGQGLQGLWVGQGLLDGVVAQEPQGPQGPQGPEGPQGHLDLHDVTPFHLICHSCVMTTPN